MSEKVTVHVEVATRAYINVDIEMEKHVYEQMKGMDDRTLCEKLVDDWPDQMTKNPELDDFDYDVFEFYVAEDGK